MVRVVGLFVLLLGVSYAQGQELWVLDDFEQGGGRWSVEFQREVSDAIPLAQLELTRIVPPKGGKQAGLFVWRKAGQGEWARFVFSLDGGQLSARKAKGLTFWWLGDGSGETVTLTLVVQRDGGERLFRTELSLPSQWQQERLSWDNFRDESGTPATIFVRYLKMMRIEKEGKFDPFFFCLDQLACEVTALTVRTVSAKVVVDFQQEERVNLLRWGTNWDERAIQLLQNPVTRKRISELRLGWARLQVNDVLKDRDFGSAARLIQQWAHQVQRLNMVAVLNLSPNKSEDLATGAFQQQAVFWAQRLFPTVKLFEIFQRPSEPPLQIRAEVCAIHFASVRDAIKQVVPTAQVGGWSEGAAWRDRLQLLFAKAPRPDFFTVHFYGTHNASTGDEELMRAARTTVSADLPYQVPLNLLDEWLKQIYPPSGVALEVTECSLNALKTPEGKAADERLNTAFGAAWFAALFVQMAGKAENLVQFKLIGDGWGLLDDEGNPQPIYWSVWACNTYFAPGTRLVVAATNYAPLLILAGKTQTANNLMLVNTTANALEVQVEAVGISTVRTVRIRLLREREAPSYTELKPSPTVRVMLPPYGVGIVQWVP